jgi:hypothetical protein
LGVNIARVLLFGGRALISTYRSPVNWISI